MLFRGLTKLMPKYAGESGQQSAVACVLCFNIRGRADKFCLHLNRK